MMCAVVHFLHDKDMSAAEIHHDYVHAVYRQNVMSEGTVRQWCRMFTVSGHLFKVVTKISVEDGVSELSCKFPQIPCTVLCEIITVSSGDHMFCPRWFPKMLTGMHKMHRTI
jgi:hypothetical protein